MTKQMEAAGAPTHTLIISLTMSLRFTQVVIAINCSNEMI